MIWLDLIDPNVVKPGWTPLLITIVMAAVLVLLYRSMRRQFGRIDVSRSQPGEIARTAATTPADPDPPTKPVGAPTEPIEGQR